MVFFYGLKLAYYSLVARWQMAPSTMLFSCGTLADSLFSSVVLLWHAGEWPLLWCSTLDHLGYHAFSFIEMPVLIWFYLIFYRNSNFGDNGGVWNLPSSTVLKNSKNHSILKTGYVIRCVRTVLVPVEGTNSICMKTILTFLCRFFSPPWHHVP
jgi:hypothetical protein